VSFSVGLFLETVLTRFCVSSVCDNSVS